MSTIDDVRRKQRGEGSTMRVPPHDLAAEESLLGAMLLPVGGINTACEAAADAGITPESFYKPAHGHIYEAITHLHAAGQPVDPVTVSAHLRDNGLLDTIGGSGALVALQAATPSIGNAGRYASIIASHHLLRRLIGTAGDIAEIGYSRPDDPAAAVDQAETAIYALADHGGRTAASVTIGPSLDPWLTELEAASLDGGVAGVPTGFHDLDYITLGLRGGQFIVVGARPSMGKTAFGGNIAINAARAGHPVLFVSVEMSLAELQSRWVSSIAKIDSKRIRAANLVPQDWPRITEAMAVFSDMPLDVMDDATATISRIRSRARRLKADGRCDLVIIDYLQLATPERRHAENRQVEVAEMSRGCKILARDLDVPVVALAQLHRGLETRGDKRPILSDLRESGAIENDADIVMFLYRDEVYHPDTDDKNIAEVIVAKHRNGQIGTAKLAWLEQYTTFANLARSL